MFYQFQTRVVQNWITFHVLLQKMVLKTIKFISAACAKVVRDQTRSTTPCRLVSSKRICAKRYSADSMRKQPVNDLYKSRWKSWRLTNHSARIADKSYWVCKMASGSQIYRVWKVWAVSFFLTSIQAKHSIHFGRKLFLCTVSRIIS